MPTRDFAAELPALQQLLLKERANAVSRLRVFHEEWARTLIGVDTDTTESELVGLVRGAVERHVAPDVAKNAAAQLAEAEGYQWEIGTWSTGSGEGLSSMFEVRTLQLARAWLVADSDPAEARKLIAQVEGDPNQIARRLEDHWQALRQRLGPVG